MPMYEYGCTACQHRFEVVQKFSDPLIEHCEKCNGPVKKLISNTSFVLKGGGWYVTDYGKSGSSTGSTSATASSSTPSDSGSGGEKASACSTAPCGNCPTA